MPEPDEVPKIIVALTERKNYLEEVKESYLQAQAALPFVQQNLEQTEWQLAVFRDLPEEALDIPLPIGEDEVKIDNQYLRAVFAVLDVPDTQLLNSTASITTSGTTDAYSFVSRVRDLAIPSVMAYSDIYVTQYQEMQVAQDRPRQVRAQLGKLNTVDMYDRFDRAYEAFRGYKSGAVARTAAANELRNLLSGLKGDLWKNARKSPKENMNWNTMSARLAIHGGQGKEHVTLAAQERRHSSLLSRLADVLKDREGGSITDLGSIWTEVLDHLYTVLGLLA